MKSESLLEEKSYKFARRVIKAYKYLTDKQEYVISKQFLRSGTSIGANIVEAQYTISKKDFRNKMSIALKEAAETRYWISLLRDEKSFKEKEANSLIKDLNEIISMLVKVVKNAT